VTSILQETFEMRIKLLAFLLALLGVMSTTPSARAVLLNPGDTSPTPDTFDTTGLTLVDSIQNAPLAPPGGVDQTIYGTYSAWVYRTASGTLDFLYQVCNDSSSADPIHRVTAANFKGFTTDVGYVTAGPLPPGAHSDGVVPNASVGGTDAVDRSANVPNGGSTIGFNFTATQIQPNECSAVLVVATNATLYKSGTLSAIDSTTSSNPAFGPAAVPEPSSMAIAGLGALGLIGYGIRRRRGS